MKRVSFKVAKALKEAGYPQGITRDVYVIREGGFTCIEYPIGVCISSSVALPQEYIADIPIYLEVWLWLWREKGRSIMISQNGDDLWEADVMYGKTYIVKTDPEEAIISAIKYIVENDLIK